MTRLTPQREAAGPDRDEWRDECLALRVEIAEANRNAAAQVDGNASLLNRNIELLGLLDEANARVAELAKLRKSHKASKHTLVCENCGWACFLDDEHPDGCPVCASEKERNLLRRTLAILDERGFDVDTHVAFVKAKAEAAKEPL